MLRYYYHAAAVVEHDVVHDSPTHTSGNALGFALAIQD